MNGTPFRAEVPVQEFHKIHRYREQIYRARKIFPAERDKPAVAEIIASFASRPDSPDEVKLEATREVFSLIKDPLKEADNRAIACTLIDMIWAQRDPAIKYRMAAVVSHDLQDDFYPPFHNDDDPTTPGANAIVKGPHLDHKKLSMEEGFDRHTRQHVFESLRNDQSVNEKYRNFAKFLVYPKPSLRAFNQLYHWQSNLDLTPKVVQEITEESAELDPGSGEPSSIAKALVRLADRYLPTFDKMAEFERETGEALPIYITWKVGRKLHSIRFPADLSSRASDLWLKFQSQEISREQVFQECKKLQNEYVSRMNPEQKAELESLGESYNLEIRFSTQREESKALENREPTPLPPGNDESQAA